MGLLSLFSWVNRQSSSKLSASTTSMAWMPIKASLPAKNLWSLAACTHHGRGTGCLSLGLAFPMRQFSASLSISSVLSDKDWKIGSSGVFFLFLLLCLLRSNLGWLGSVTAVFVISTLFLHFMSGKILTDGISLNFWRGNPLKLQKLKGPNPLSSES